MRLEFSRFVEGDLDAIAAFIAADNPRRAVTFIQNMCVKFVAIARDPLIYQLRPDIGLGARIASGPRGRIVAFNRRRPR